MPPERLALFFRDEPLDFRPGSRFAHTNSGYVPLGLILEEVPAKPYAGLLNERVFVPQRRTKPRYYDDRTLVPNRPTGINMAIASPQHAPQVCMSQAYAAGAVCSTVLDLIRWSRALSLGAVVGRDGYEQMSAPATLRDGSRIEYCCGPAVSYLEEHHRVNHIGRMLGFTGQISNYDEDGVTVVVLTNTEGANAAHIESEIARTVLGLAAQNTQDLLLSAEELAAYTGTYALGLAEVTVTAVHGRLRATVSVPGLEGSYPLRNQGQHEFLAQSDPDVSAIITMDPAGVAQGVSVSQKGITTRADRIRR